MITVDYIGIKRFIYLSTKFVLKNTRIRAKMEVNLLYISGPKNQINIILVWHITIRFISLRK